jgi:tetratricopeptide (TPR) repeat protein
MWWLLALAGVLFALFWPTRRRRWTACFCSAQQALARRDWAQFDKQCALAVQVAERWKEPDRGRALATTELLAAHAAYWRAQPALVEQHLGRAVDLLELSGAPDKERSLAIAHQLWGELHFDRNALAQAEEHYRGAVNSAQISGDEALMIFFLQRLSDVLLDQQRREEARSVIERCMELERKVIYEGMQQRSAGPATEQIISMSMPDHCLAVGDYPRAEKLFQEKVDHWMRMVTRCDNIDVTRYQFHLATAQRQQGRVSEAVQTLRQACDTAERDFGTRHPRVGVALTKLAATLRDAGEAEEAVIAEKRAAALRA